MMDLVFFWGGSSFSFVVYSDGDGDVMKILDDGEIL